MTNATPATQFAELLARQGTALHELKILHPQWGAVLAWNGDRMVHSTKADTVASYGATAWRFHKLLAGQALCLTPADGMDGVATPKEQQRRLDRAEKRVAVIEAEVIGAKNFLAQVRKDGFGD